MQSSPVYIPQFVSHLRSRSRTSPHLTWLRDPSLAWLEEFSLPSQGQSKTWMETLGADRYVAFMYPYVERDKAVLLINWTNWVAIVDDRVDRPDLRSNPQHSRQFFARMRTILDETSGESARSKDTLESSLAWLAEATRNRLGTVSAYIRFVTALQKFFDGCVEETRNRADHRLLSLDEYIPLRRMTGVMHFFLALIEVGTSVDLPTEVWNSSELMAMHDAVNDYISWMNDVHSAMKERRAGEFHNLVFVIERTESLSLQEAIDRAAAMCESALDRFVRLRLNFPSFGLHLDSVLQQYFELLEMLMGGFERWSTTSRRYALDGTGAVLRSRPPVPLSSSVKQRDLPRIPRLCKREASMKISHQSLRIATHEHLQFVDVTEAVTDIIYQCEITNGFVNIQTRHTTTAIIVNEHEPLLLEDMKKLLEYMVPQDRQYQHDNFAIRTTNLCPEERENGHSHCRALMLGTSETVNILDGRLQLGRWQRIFFVELDGARERDVSVTVIGA